MRESELSALRPWRILRCGVLCDVECMKAVAQSHEHTAVLGVLLGDAKPEHVTIESLRRFLVDDPQQHVADTAQVDHVRFPLLARLNIS